MGVHGFSLRSINGLKAAIRKIPLISDWHLLLLAGIFLILAVRPTPPVTLALMGDVMVGRGVAQAHTSGDWETAFTAVAPALTRADLTLANLESPVLASPLSSAFPEVNGDRGEGNARQGYNLCTSPIPFPFLAAAGFDLFSVANNHANDCGDPAGTLAALRSNELTPIGPGFIPVYRRINSLRLAFFAFDDVSAPLDVSSATKAIAQAKRSGALVIVSIHWGWEFDTAPTDRQTMLAQAFAGAGAALVWGHHPHVLQRVDWIHRDGQPRPALVAYSLGNALFDQVVPPDARRAAILLVTFDSSGVKSVQAVPTWIEALQGRVVPADDEASQAILRRLGPVIEPMTPDTDKP